MLQDLKVLNGRLSLKFNPLNTKYTVYINDNDNKLNLEYKIDNNDKILIEGNNSIKDYKEILIIVYNEEESMEYHLYVYKENTSVMKTEETFFSNIETSTQKEVPYYAVPIISSISFIIILFAFTIIFKKRK